MRNALTRHRRASVTQTGEAPPVWVLETGPRPGPAESVAERLGLPYRVLHLRYTPLSWLACLRRKGGPAGLGRDPEAEIDSPPAIVIASGARGGAAALWLKAQYGTRAVFCGTPFLHGGTFDLIALPSDRYPGDDANVLSILGPPHGFSPMQVQAAEFGWYERLSHLPRPRVALIAGGPRWLGELQPARAHRLGRSIAALVSRQGGSIMAMAGRRTGAEATDALAATLMGMPHDLHRAGEPGPDPLYGFLALADAIVVTADRIADIAHACATTAPVYVAMPELASRDQRATLHALMEAGHIRWLAGSLAAYRRTPLDEAGRIAQEILRRFPLDEPEPAA